MRLRKQILITGLMVYTKLRCNQGSAGWGREFFSSFSFQSHPAHWSIMRTFLNVANKVFDLVNDSEFTLDHAKDATSRAIRVIETVHTFEYMLQDEFIAPVQKVFVTTFEWKRRTEVRLYISRDNSYKFLHRLEYRQNSGDRIPVSYLPFSPTPELSENVNVPYYYSLGKYFNSATAEEGYAGPAISGRRVELYPPQDELEQYFVYLSGYAYTPVGVDFPDDSLHWLFDNAFDAVVYKALTISVEFTEDYESFAFFDSQFKENASVLIASDTEDIEEEASEICMEYAGENVSINDPTQLYPPIRRSRVIFDS